MDGTCGCADKSAYGTIAAVREALEVADGDCVVEEARLAQDDVNAVYELRELLGIDPDYLPGEDRFAYSKRVDAMLVEKVRELKQLYQNQQETIRSMYADADQLGRRYEAKEREIADLREQNDRMKRANPSVAYFSLYRDIREALHCPDSANIMAFIKEKQALAARFKAELDYALENNKTLSHDNVRLSQGREKVYVQGIRAALGNPPLSVTVKDAAAQLAATCKEQGECINEIGATLKAPPGVNIRAFVKQVAAQLVVMEKMVLAGLVKPLVELGQIGGLGQVKMVQPQPRMVSLVGGPFNGQVAQFPAANRYIQLTAYSGQGLFARHTIATYDSGAYNGTTAYFIGSKDVK